MDTVLNLGLNDTVVEGLAAKRGERFAYDCYRRLLDMFGDVVLGIDHALFEAEIHAVKASHPPPLGPRAAAQGVRLGAPRSRAQAACRRARLACSRPWRTFATPVSSAGQRCPPRCPGTGALETMRSRASQPHAVPRCRRRAA